VYDILTAEDGRVTWGNGMMYYRGGYDSDVDFIRSLPAA
jgi:hypothetical protein